MFREIIIFLCLFTLIAVGACGNSSNHQTASVVKAVKENVSDKLIVSMNLSEKQPIKQGDLLSVDFKLSTDDIDSLFLVVGENRLRVDVTSGKAEIPTSKISIGKTIYSLELYKNGVVEKRSASFKLLPASAPKEYTVTVVASYPHSTKSYTQGLEFYNGYLYESGGQYGESFVEYMTFPGMKRVKREEFDEKYFNEGLTILNDKLYLLTWHEKTCFVLDPKTLKTINTYQYATEGWGITNNGTNLFMSDGTQFITEINPDGFKPIRQIEVLSSSGEVHSINEMEWINDEIWANVYGYDVILIINPYSGEIKGIIRVPELLKKMEMGPTTDVLNGIAYDAKSKKIYLTGKNWPKIFEVVIK